jgi:thiamine pyrophosphate-dependent acetolactate synthase large subunit-like protein
MTVETLAPLRVYEAVAQALVADGSEAVFGLMGDDTAALLVAIQDCGIAYYGARHENQAVAMADGYARVTRRAVLIAVSAFEKPGPPVTVAMPTRRVTRA